MHGRLPFASRVVSLVSFVMMLFASPGFAAWPNAAGINLPLCIFPDNQNAPATATGLAGATFVAWSDNRSGNFDIYVQRISATGVPAWTEGGVAVCTATGTQTTPVMASDDRGGVIVAWQDLRGANNDIYVQRLNESGVAQWTANGVLVLGGVGGQVTPAILTDNNGGAFVACSDGNVRLAHVRISGDIAWSRFACTEDGFMPCIATEQMPAITLTDSSGVIIAWVDNRIGIDVFAQRFDSLGTTRWNVSGVLMGGDPTAFSSGSHNWLTTDGAGGAIAAWLDVRRFGVGFFDFYARRIAWNGVPQWAADGVVLGAGIAAPGLPDIAANWPPKIISDAAGGAIIPWSTRNTAGAGNILAQRINSIGAVQWGASGVTLCAAAGDQQLPSIIQDGFGGAVVAWQDDRATTGGIYARSVTSTGVLEWTADGVPLTFAGGNQQAPSLTRVGAGDAVAAWVDFRNGATSDIYAQRISSSACLGADEPALLSVRDVPNDQGGKVKLTWEASCPDAASPFNIDTYRIWRSAPSTAVQASLARGAVMVVPGEAIPADARQVFLRSAEGSADYAWELVASQAAAHLTSYSYTASTTSDSVAASNPRTFFMIEARTASGAAWWFSNPDSGYSVDNLGPAAPAAFEAQYFPGTAPSGASKTTAPPFVWLHWGRNAEPDFLEYRLHRGANPSFVPGPGNLISAQPDTGYQDIDPPDFYYKLMTIDQHGNASIVAAAIPENIVGVPPTQPVADLWFSPGSPNPSGGDVVIAFGLPREAHVALRVYDAAGRTMRTLVKGPMPAGPHSLRWDGRDDRGRACPSGLYVGRLDVEGQVRQGKIVLSR